MNYLLDTDTIIYWLKGNERIEEKAVSVGLENIRFSIISKAELYFGAHNSKLIKKNIKNVQKVSATLAMVHFDDSAAENFGKIKADLSKSGNIIPDADIMIAAIARINDLILVTNNTLHFKRIPGLKIENWIK